MHESNLLITLVFALGAGTIAAILAARLGQSVILGYILAGVAIGPHTPGFIGDQETVQALADIGVALLMFSIGVQLSPRDLLRLGSIATLGGIAQVAALVGIGYIAGIAVGMTPFEALVLGSVVSISSSAVAAKLLDERSETDALQGKIALAWASLQDLSTIFLVVIISALGGAERSTADIFWAVGKAALFLVLLLPVGVWLLPRLFTRVVALHSREVFVITVAAVALGVAYISTYFGLALALGAFAAGIVVSESDLWHRILGEIIPLRDVFAGLFFVSVGMLVDPRFVVSHWPLLLLVLALIVVVKGLVLAGIALLFGSPVRVACTAAALMAQSGEFSFFLARMGQQSGGVSADVFNAMLAGAVISIALAPNIHRVGSRLGRWLEARRPVTMPGSLGGIENKTKISGHAIICGYGRVGSTIGEALRQYDIPIYVVDQEIQLVRRLQESGIHAFVGGIDNRVILEQLNLPQAKVFIVAIPDAFVTRQLVEYAHSVAPDLPIVARTHSEREQNDLEQLGALQTVMGERALALEMVRYALARYALSGPDVDAFIQKFSRASREGDSEDAS